MRRIGLILLVLLVVLGAAVGLALLNVNRYLNENRAWIEEQAESATGRRISFGEIGLSLWGGLGARVSELRVADDPAFSQEPFVEAAVARVNVAILPALFGRIEVREVVLEEPVVRVIRAKSGMNFETIGPATAPSKPADSGKEEPPSVEQAGNALALVVALFTIRDGHIEYTDRTVSPPTSQAVRRLDVEATGVGSADPVTIDFAAAVLGSDDQNFRLGGEVGPVRLESAREPDSIAVDLTLQVGPLSLGELADPIDVTGRAQGSLGKLRVELELAFAALRAKGEGTVSPGPPLTADLKVDANASQLALVSVGAAAPGVRDPERLRELRAEGRLEIGDDAPKFEGELRIAGGSVRDVPFEGFKASVSLADDIAYLSKIEIAVFGGSYEGKGHYDFRDPGSPRFEANQKLTDLEVAAALESQAPDAAGRMTGRLSGTLELSGSGASSEEIRGSLQGRGDVAVADGVLHGVNLPEAILESLTGIGGLTSLLSEDLRAKYVDVFSADDTPFEKLSASVRIGEGHATTDDAVIAARDYTLRGDGSVAFDGELDFTTTFVASEQLTADVIKSVREVRHITSSDGRLEIPVKLVGVLPDVSVEPDSAFIAKSATRGAIGKGLEYLGIGKDEPTEEAEETEEGEAEAPDGAAPEEKQKDSTAESIEKGLRSLFGD